MRNTLTRADLAEKLFETLGLNKREAKEMVDAFFEETLTALENNQQVKLSGFGNLDLREKKLRPGRNLKTGETMPIAARRVVTKSVSTRAKVEIADWSVFWWRATITRRFALRLRQDN